MADQNATQETLLQTSRFGVEIDKTVHGFFRACSGLESKTEVITYKSVGENGKLFEQKVPGHTNYSDITLKQSLGSNTFFWEWRELVEQGDYGKFRKSGAVVLYDEQGNPQDRYEFTAGWLSSWKFTDLDANADDVVLQEITIAHEGITRAS